MLSSLRNQISREDGFTVVELSMVVVMMSLIGAIIMGMLGSLFSTTGYQFSLAAAQRDSQPALRQMVIDIRQAVPRGSAGDLHPVEELDWDRIVIYTDTAPSDGVPNQVEYALVNCVTAGSDQLCDLQYTSRAPDDPSADTFTYSGTGGSRILVENVLASDGNGSFGPLFGGVTWVGDPSVRTVVAQCSGSGCDLPLITIDLRIDPSLVKDNPRIYEIHEEVRIRNG